jgi:hypothetical protein
MAGVAKTGLGGHGRGRCQFRRGLPIHLHLAHLAVKVQMETLGQQTLQHHAQLRS